MPAIRTRNLEAAGPSTSSTSLKKDTKKLHKYQKKESAIPGVSKLKSALRQTRRLLAKERLAPNVRVETERRLKALEGDLAKAEVLKKERSLAVKYHKIKFFDRQKLIRKIKQMKKQLEDSGLSSKEKKKLNAALFELRVDLNYVINYPKTEKYISLFPPEVRHDADGAVEPIHLPPDAETKTATDAKREELRHWVRGRMRVGELNAEPEMLERRDNVEAGIAWEKPAKGANEKGSAQRWKAKETVVASGVQDDGFFEDPAEEAMDEESDEAEASPPPSPRKVKKPKGEKERKKSRSVKTPTLAVEDDFFED